MSNANEVALRSWEETTFGAAATGTPQFTDIRFTSESLRAETALTRSQEIRSDRFTADQIRTNFSAAGDINFELSYGSFDHFLEAALLSADWTAVQTNTGTFSTSGSTITGTGVDTSISVGDTVRLKDGSTILGYHKVSAVTSGTLTVTPAPSALTGDGDEEVEAGGELLAGTTFRSFNIEREYTDLTSEFSLFTGMAVNTMSLSMAPESIITGTFGFIGQDETTTTADTGNGSPATPGSGNKPFNGIDHVFAIWEANAVLTVREFSLSLNNNLFPRLVLGTLGPTSIGTGSIDLSGTMQVTYDSTAATLFDKYLNQTETSLQIILEDADDNAYSIDIPAVVMSAGQRVAGGLNTDVIADLSWAAKIESTESQMLRIQRFAA